MQSQTNTENSKGCFWVISANPKHYYEWKRRRISSSRYYGACINYLYEHKQIFDIDPTKDRLVLLENWEFNYNFNNSSVSALLDKLFPNWQSIKPIPLPWLHKNCLTCVHSCEHCIFFMPRKPFLCLAGQSLPEDKTAKNDCLDFKGNFK